MTTKKKSNKEVAPEAAPEDVLFAELVTTTNKLVEATEKKDKVGQAIAGLSYMTSLVKLGERYGENLEDVQIGPGILDELTPRARALALLSVPLGLQELIRQNEKSK